MRKKTHAMKKEETPSRKERESRRKTLTFQIRNQLIEMKETNLSLIEIGSITLLILQIQSIYFNEPLFYEDTKGKIWLKCRISGVGADNDCADTD